MDIPAFSADDLIKMIGLLIAGAGTLFGVAKWLMARMDKAQDQTMVAIKQAMDAAEKAEDGARDATRRVHVRLDALPDIYIRRQEVMEHLVRIERGQTEHRQEVNLRLDRIVQMLGETAKRNA